MDNEPKLLKHIEVVAQRVRHHHDALWEEEKHYTWWIYITLGSLFGIFIALTGYSVIRLESEHFYEARQLYARTVIALGLNQPIPRPNGDDPITLFPEEEIKVEDFKSVRSNANKSWDNLLTSALKRELGIRDAFQLTFFLTACLFIIIFFYSALTFVRLQFF